VPFVVELRSHYYYNYGYTYILICVVDEQMRTVKYALSRVINYLHVSVAIASVISVSTQ
jgi:hypothetical protein